ncbi:MAG: PH domain-containing protein [Flavobacteriia bacterium]|jgi:hypothetical protein|nr:PH domain-containing protein [Cryomorphaceae bacterium]
MKSDLPFFRTRIDLGMKIIPGLLFLGILIPAVYNAYHGNWSDCCILLTVLLLQQLLFWGIFRSTHYTFETDTLLCRSLMFKRRISYESIRKIEQNTSLYAGLKMSTAFRGIIIHYNKYDELFISPAESERFIALLKERNEGILVN